MTAASMTTNSTTRTASIRPGRDDMVLGGATCRRSVALSGQRKLYRANETILLDVPVAGVPVVRRSVIRMGIWRALGTVRGIVLRNHVHDGTPQHPDLDPWSDLDDNIPVIRGDDRPVDAGGGPDALAW